MKVSMRAHRLERGRYIKTSFMGATSRLSFGEVELSYSTRRSQPLAPGDDALFSHSRFKGLSSFRAWDSTLDFPTEAELVGLSILFFLGMKWNERIKRLP